MDQLSPSKITLYADCSLRWKFHYIDKIIKPISSIHLVYGSAIHKAIETFNLSLIKKQIPYLEDAFQSFQDCWEKEIEQQNIKLSSYTYKLYEMGLNAIENFYHNHLDYEVIATEYSFKVPLIWPDSYDKEKFYPITSKPYMLRGIIDAIIKRKNELIIIDYKTSKEKYNRFKIDTSTQLAIYAYAFRYLLSQNIFENIKHKKENAIAYHIFIKNYDTLESIIELQKKKITDAHLNRMFNILAQTINGIENEIYIPNYDSQNCKWCDFKKECLAWQ